MKMKRVFSSLMALGLAATLVACGGDKAEDAKEKTDDKAAEAPADNKEAPAEGEEGKEDEKAELESFDKQTADDTLVIGAVQEFNGDFLQGWTNNSMDVKARRFLGIEGNNGYGTVVQDEGGQWINNMTVLKEEPETVKNADGSETTTYKIKEDLKWSDGTPINADNYLFGSLLHTYPSYQLVTGSTSIGDDSLMGYEAYKNGDKDTFDGLKKIDDYTFSVTVDASFLPYYEEAALRGYGPYPIHAVSENLAVAPEGNKIVAKDGYQPTEEEKKKYIENIDTQIAKNNEDFEENNPAPAEDANEDEKKAYEEAKKAHDEDIAKLEKRKTGDVDPTSMLIEDAMQKEYNK